MAAGVGLSKKGTKAASPRRSLESRWGQIHRKEFIGQRMVIKGSNMAERETNVNQFAGVNALAKRIEELTKQRDELTKERCAGLEAHTNPPTSYAGSWRGPQLVPRLLSLEARAIITRSPSSPVGTFKTGPYFAQANKTSFFGKLFIFISETSKRVRRRSRFR